MDIGVFHEFVEADTFFDKIPKRITLKDAQLDVYYVMIIPANKGPWSYDSVLLIIFFKFVVNVFGSNILFLRLVSTLLLK